jgi:hypothetical protein
LKNKELFREKSLDRISSPEQIDDYIHVVRPKTWILLIVILLLIAAAVVWGFMGRIDVRTVTDGQAAVESVTPVSFLMQ